MATTYEQTTTTASAGPMSDIRPDPGYVRTIPGMLKIAEIVLDILVLICASIDYWYPVGGGWVQFVAASAMITTVILFIFHFFHIISRLPGPWTLIELIYYAIYVLFYLIAAIVAAVRAPHWPSVGAACFFAFAALAVYAIDCFFMYRDFRSVQHSHTAGTGGPVAAATTTTTTTYETRTQY